MTGVPALSYRAAVTGCGRIGTAHALRQLNQGSVQQAALGAAVDYAPEDLTAAIEERRKFQRRVEPFGEL